MQLIALAHELVGELRRLLFEYFHFRSDVLEKTGVLFELRCIFKLLLVESGHFIFRRERRVTSVAQLFIEVLELRLEELDFFFEIREIHRTVVSAFEFLELGLKFIQTVRAVFYINSEFDVLFS